jgi:hypothetical protein
MKRLLLLLFILPCFAPIAHGQNYQGCLFDGNSGALSLGGGWTCYNGSSQFSLTGVLPAFLNPLTAGHSLVAWCGNGANVAGATESISDNAGNTWDWDTILYSVAVSGSKTVNYTAGCTVSGGTGPGGATCSSTISSGSVTAITVTAPGIYFHSGGTVTISVPSGSGQTFTATMGNATWNSPATSQYTLGWVVNSLGKASGYQVTCSNTAGSNDGAVMEVGYGGGVSRGIETGALSQAQTNGATTAAGGTCPCAAFSGSITTTINGDLILAAINSINGDLDTWTSGFSHNVYSLTGPQTTAGVQNFQWSDTTASDLYFTGVMALEPSIPAGSTVLTGTTALINSVKLGASQ